MKKEQSFYNIRIIISTFIIFGLHTTIVFSQSGWFQQSSGTDATLYSVHFENQNTGWAVGYGNSGSVILKTNNSGLNWFIQFISSSIHGLNSVIFTDTSNGWIAVDEGAIILRTSNGGLNWSQFSVGSSSIHLQSVYFVNSTTGWVAGSNIINAIILKTTNGGINWMTQFIGTPNPINAIHFINENTGFAVGWGGLVLKTVNGGTNWLSQIINPNYMLNSVYFVGPDDGWIAGNFIPILRTTNGGTNWITHPGGLSYRLFSVNFLNSNIGWVAGYDSLINGIIMRTTNAGGNWYSQFTNAGRLYSIIFIDNNTGWSVGAANNNGTILKTTTGGEPIGIQPISSEIPQQFILYQNYPNPFNPTTKIKFSIPPSRGARGVTRLTIYDILGREIDVLVKEQLSPGIYEAEWNGTNFSSGVYFYQLSINNEQLATKKMVLIK